MVLVGSTSLFSAAKRFGITRTCQAPVPVGVRNTSIVLAGVAVAALFTAVQTYLQQQHVATIQEVYSWILGQLTLASWSDVRTVAPYAAAVRTSVRVCRASSACASK